jgi:hypothetical protein
MTPLRWDELGSDPCATSAMAARVRPATAAHPPAVTALMISRVSGHTMRSPSLSSRRIIPGAALVSAGARDPGYLVAGHFGPVPSRIRSLSRPAKTVLIESQSHPFRWIQRHPSTNGKPSRMPANRLPIRNGFRLEGSADPTCPKYQRRYPEPRSCIPGLGTSPRPRAYRMGKLGGLGHAYHSHSHP